MHKSNFQLIILLFSLLVYGYFNLQSQNISPISNKKIHQYIIENGMSLIGKPYKGGTLESEGPEKLTYFDDAFDCVTFVEYVLAKSKTQDIIDKENFESYLTKMRYRDGVINGYGSRLHYFTEWILQNCTQNNFQDITKSIGGIPYVKTINFISRHKSKYAKLSVIEDLEKIKTSEKRLNNHKRYYIPKKTLTKVQHRILDGDVIAFTTSISGLDVVHTGFAKWVKGKLCLLHASETEKKVVLTSLSLAEYIMRNQNQSGIIVVRCLK
ncbi:MAG: DUF1460 domain-containing protein [Saprospiraceae bacterium]|nr:DUF1460 domain-containing protein [Saprospiraceae bacterium]